MKPRKLTPKEEAIAFDKARDKKAGNESLTKEQKEKIKEQVEGNRVYAENTKRENLKPFEEFLTDPLAKIKFLCEKGDFAGSYDKRVELFSLMTMVKIQQALESVNLNEKSRK